MRRMSQAAAASLAALLAGALVAFDAAPARAAPPKESKPSGNATFAATVSPTRLAPGQSGVIQLVGTIKKGVHVYPESFKVKPREQAGVTYGKHKVTTKTKPYKDQYAPADEAPEQVWFDRIDIELPFTLTDAALPPLKVGADVTWSCCDEGQCYAPETTKDPALAEVLPPDGWVRPAGAPPVEVPADPAMAATASPAPPGPSEPPADSSMGPPPAPPVVASPDATAPAAAAPAELTLSSLAATVRVRATSSTITATFTPSEGYHLYAPGAKDAEPISLEGVDVPGTRWRAAAFPSFDGDEIHKPVDVTMAYELTDALSGDATFVVRWAGCSTTCEQPQEKRVALRREGGKPTGALGLFEVGKDKPVAPAPSPAAGTPVPPPAPATTSIAGLPAGQLFPEIKSAESDTIIDRWWKAWGYLIFLPLFGTGILLAFTPCVLPLIPITVSIIGGGSGDLSKGRMTFLLSCYVAGLSLTYGSLGLAAGLMGGGLAGAFQHPVALFVIAGIFLFLAFGMFGVIELQPPAWLQRLQGGAKGGSPVGAFLMGALGAVIASPCTGPVIAFMLVFIAQSGSVVMGFFMFLAVGLGMGAVLFAAGSLNMLARPGPWMVWVRYFFGIVLLGVALYYLADADKISPRVLFLLGGACAVLAAVLIQRHLIHKEGEESGAATKKAGVVAIATALATLVVALLTRPHEGALKWTDIDSSAKLVAEVAQSKKDGKPVVVDFWATWCPKCKSWDRAIEGNEALTKAFSKMTLLRVNLSNDDRPWEDGVREAVHAPQGTQPYLLFMNKDGEIIGDSRLADGPNPDHERKFVEILKTLGVVK